MGTTAVVLNSAGEAVGSIETAARGGTRVMYAFNTAGGRTLLVDGRYGTISRSKRAFAAERMRLPAGELFVRLEGSGEIVTGIAYRWHFEHETCSDEEIAEIEAELAR